MTEKVVPVYDAYTKQLLSYPENHQYFSSLSRSGRTGIREALQHGVGTNTPGWNLVRAVADQNKGVSFNPYLTTYKTAKRWLANQQAKDEKNKTSFYTDWKVHAEDLDNNIDTPDDVVIFNSRGEPQVVSGYSLNSGKGRRKVAVLYTQYPTKKRSFCYTQTSEICLRVKTFYSIFV
jgi:hypothetical protein